MSWSLTIVTLLGGLTFLPRPYVSPPSVPLSPNNAFSISFDVSNSGLLLLTDVEAIFAIGQIGFGDSKPDQHFIPSFVSRFRTREWQHHRLAVDERFTINLTRFCVVT